VINAQRNREATMSDCIFCGIVAGNRPASVVYRDALALVFLDIRPVTPGHLLVVPLVHATGLGELDPEIAAHLMAVAQRLAAALRRSGLRCEGVNLFLADGEAAGQEVFHVHLHVFPRFRGDGFGLRFGPGYGERPSREELDRHAGAIRSGLQAETEQ